MNLRNSRPTAVAVLLALIAAPAISQRPRADANKSASRLQVYAYTLRHQPVHEALALIRDLLSEEGTVEVQPGGNTLVLRDFRARIARVVPVLESFDHPPQDLRFEIRIMRAGPKGQAEPAAPEPAAPEPAAPEPAAPEPAAPEPAEGPAKSGLAEHLEARLRSFLRYDEYEVLARAAVTSRERQQVTYSLGSEYSVSFRPGTVMGGRSGQRLKLENFRIHKKVDNPTNKGRRLEPIELYHATLNLWVGRPFSLVLAQDDSRKQALLISISCRREADGADETR